MVKEAQSGAQEEVVSVELSAPPAWKKLVSLSRHIKICTFVTEVLSFLEIYVLLCLLVKFWHLGFACFNRVFCFYI